MNSLIPITSTTIPNRREAILLDPAHLQGWFGYQGGFQIAKTHISVGAEDIWTISLEDCGRNTILLRSSDVKTPKAPSIDLIETLGYQVTLTHWQKLIFRTDGLLGACVTFLIDSP